MKITYFGNFKISPGAIVVGASYDGGELFPIAIVNAEAEAVEAVEDYLATADTELDPCPEIFQVWSRDDRGRYQQIAEIEMEGGK